MKKTIISICIIIFSFVLSAQNEKPEKELNKGIELSVGKFFSPYRYFKHYTAYESIHLSFTHQLSDKFGTSINQHYGRMFDDNTNSRAFVLSSTINLSAIIIRKNNFDVKISAGTGLEQIHIKCLYDYYPLERHFYGIPINTTAYFIYHLNQKTAINVNINASYSFLFNNENSLFADYSYYQTCFLSSNIGVIWHF
jgi:hypothetical protein